MQRQSREVLGLVLMECKVLTTPLLQLDPARDNHARQVVCNSHAKSHLLTIITSSQVDPTKYRDSLDLAQSSLSPLRSTTR